MVTEFGIILNTKKEEGLIKFILDSISKKIYLLR